MNATTQKPSLSRSRNLAVPVALAAIALLGVFLWRSRNPSLPVIKGRHDQVWAHQGRLFTLDPLPSGESNLVATAKNGDAFATLLKLPQGTEAGSFLFADGAAYAAQRRNAPPPRPRDVPMREGNTNAPPPPVRTESTRGLTGGAAVVAKSPFPIPAHRDWLGMGQEFPADIQKIDLASGAVSTITAAAPEPRPVAFALTPRSLYWVNARPTIITPDETRKPNEPTFTGGCQLLVQDRNGGTPKVIAEDVLPIHAKGMLFPLGEDLYWIDERPETVSMKARMLPPLARLRRYDAASGKIQEMAQFAATFQPGRIGNAQIAIVSGRLQIMGEVYAAEGVPLQKYELFSIGSDGAQPMTSTLDLPLGTRLQLWQGMNEGLWAVLQAEEEFQIARLTPGATVSAQIVQHIPASFTDQMLISYIGFADNALYYRRLLDKGKWTYAKIEDKGAEIITQINRISLPSGK